MEQEGQEEERRIASMSLISAIQTKMMEHYSGCIYVETEVRGKNLQATKELTDEISLSYKKEKGLCQGI